MGSGRCYCQFVFVVRCCYNFKPKMLFLVTDVCVTVVMAFTVADVVPLW